MRDRSAIVRLTSMLCLLAVLALQGFGPGRLYVCACAGEPVITSQAACEEMDDQSSDHQCPDGHMHVAARDEMTASAPLKTTVPAAPLLAVLSWPSFELVAPPIFSNRAPVGLGDGDPPSTAVAVARTVVFLI